MLLCVITLGDDKFNRNGNKQNKNKPSRKTVGEQTLEAALQLGVLVICISFVKQRWQ